jgi:phosphinothricin acetyltransferase
MNASIEVRPARDSDMPAFAAIVNYFIEITTAKVRTEPQRPDEWRDDWKLLGERYPWLVAEDGDGKNGDGKNGIVGLAYAGPWKPRAAYGWSAECTVYVADGQHRRGIGRLLYGRLLAILDAQGYRSAIGVIAQPNQASVALHEACGFRPAGMLAAAGYKHGRWVDVGFWQRMSATADAGEPPAVIRPVSAVEAA